MVHIERACECDVEALTQIQTRTFNEETRGWSVSG